MKGASTKMDLEAVRAHVRRWVETTLSVPSPRFQNLPPCPYSREALLKDKVDIRCVDGGQLLACVADLATTWDDRHELVLLAAEPDTIAPEALAAGIVEANACLEASDLVVFFDHPRCMDPKHRVTSANGRYVFVGMQRLSLFIEAARPLHKRKYFEQAEKQYQVVKHLEKRG